MIYGLLKQFLGRDNQFMTFTECVMPCQLYNIWIIVDLTHCVIKYCVQYQIELNNLCWCSIYIICYCNNWQKSYARILFNIPSHITNRFKTKKPTQLSIVTVTSPFSSYAAKSGVSWIQPDHTLSINMTSMQLGSSIRYHLLVFLEQLPEKLKHRFGLYKENYDEILILRLVLIDIHGSRTIGSHIMYYKTNNFIGMWPWVLLLYANTKFKQYLCSNL